MPYLRLTDRRSGEVLEFEVAEVRMGRAPDCEHVISGSGSEVVSGYHLRLSEQGGGWTVEDTGSRNGSFLDDAQLTPSSPQPLLVGQMIRFGERGPEFKVEAVAKRTFEETLLEAPPVIRPSDPTLPMSPYSETEPLDAGQMPVPPPSPEPPPPPKRTGITILLVELRTGERWEAQGGRLRIGRGKECEVRPIGAGDTSVSRVHAEIVLKPNGKVIIRDAQSRNGTWLNGKNVTGEQPLAPGDQIQLGEHGPQMTVEKLEVPGAEPEVVAPAPSEPEKPAANGARRAAAKLGAPRRSFGGQGATVFFREMFSETERKTARRTRVVIWSSVVALAVAVAAMYWYSERRVQEATEALGQRQQAAIAAIADSMRQSANADYDRLRLQLEEARRSAAPAVVVDSLRVALQVAQQRTSALEASLRRAQSSLDEQLAAGDSLRRVAQADLDRVRQQLSSASSIGTPLALLDSLRALVRSAEQREASITSQLRAVRGVDLPAVAQANQGAIGLVAAYITGGIKDGTGFVITPSGYLVTNRHVVTHDGQNADSVFVTMADQRTPKPADLVAVALRGTADLAVLRIRDYSGPHVPSVDWSGENVRQGESAALIGFPAGLGNALDASGTVRTLMSAGVFSRVTADNINFDGFTTGGSSGSPIFNANGDVVAIHRAGLREATGLGFAVPIGKLVVLLPADARAELGLP